MSDPHEYTKSFVPKGGRKPRPVSERFWSKVNKTDDCWLWTAYTHPNGYGFFYFDGFPTPAHRVAYELVKGPIPEGLTIDHLCRVRHCVNPDHLEAVTYQENCLRGEAPSARLHLLGQCKRGHPVTPENTYLHKNGKRRCRVCARAYDNRRYALKKAAKAKPPPVA